VESWVSRDRKQYRGTDTRHEERLLAFLVDAALLKRQVAFPDGKESPSEPPKGRSDGESAIVS
jgi:hypothetical protein